MKVKNGMASSSSLARIPPKMRPGMACRKSKVKKPDPIARKPKPNPSADSENATG